jgi:magnesium transporter
MGPKVTVALRGADGRVQWGGEELLASPGTKWIDIEAPDKHVLNSLSHRYHLHWLAIEDCLHLDQRPKVEEYPDHQFIVLQGFTSDPEEPQELTLHEIHFFLGADWLITVHERDNPALAAVRGQLTENGTVPFSLGADFFFYLVADALIDLNFPVLDGINELIDELESDIFEGPTQGQLQRAFQLKRSLVFMRRVLSPQRDVVGLLARRGLLHIQDKTTLYFRDVYDHLVRLHERMDTARDLVGNAMEAYLSVMANKTNDITKQLTIFATIFLPLSFISGFFGQNFPVLGKEAFFWVMLALTLSIPLGLLAWFRKRGWL